jgi:hypothetical protein
MAFVYKNLPAFSLKPGDTIAFDLSSQNDVDIQLQINMAPTTNTTDVTTAPPTQIVSNTQVPANPRGNTVPGDYELTFTSQAAFNFAGGGLALSLGNPGGDFATDMDATGSSVQTNNATPSDPSGLFLERLLRDADGTAPWDDPTPQSFIAGFRLKLADVPSAPPVTTTPTPTVPGTMAPKKKCKKKHKKHSAAAAKKRCKKKKRR